MSWAANEVPNKIPETISKMLVKKLSFMPIL